jgi:UDP-N-acetylglucosamine 2-epimerase (non-hydrolysing)
MKKGPIALILGIRPDVIRASIIIREMRSSLPNDFILIWSGQHYSDNLKDIFFRELGIESPDYELNIEGESDAELSANVITKLSNLLQKTNTSLAVFLGDTNTVLGTIAAAQLNIPIIHIEGCMRSYDWRMPEEKYRTIADHLSDRIYAYLPDYKLQGISEGIPESNILVTGNPIVDVLNEYFLSKKLRLKDEEVDQLLASKYKTARFNYLVMTCHRRENVENEFSLNRIISLAKATSELVLFPAGYRTQKMLINYKIKLPDNIVMVDPIGYLELLELFMNSNGILTDSGTVVEEASILGIPSIQMRTSTERPEVYISNSSVKFDPHTESSIQEALIKFNELKGSKWDHLFGDGRASYRIVEDLITCFNIDNFSGHNPKNFGEFSARSFM